MIDNCHFPYRIILLIIDQQTLVESILPDSSSINKLTYTLLGFSSCNKHRLCHILFDIINKTSYRHHYVEGANTSTWKSTWKYAKFQIKLIVSKKNESLKYSLFEHFLLQISVNMCLLFQLPIVKSKDSEILHTYECIHLLNKNNF